MKNTASAYLLSPAELPGKRMVGTSTFSFILMTVSSSRIPYAPVEPPIMIASVPPSTAAREISAACSGVWDAGSIRVR